MTQDRCPWQAGNELMIEYHDKEWGVPLHDDRKHFEFLVLDAFQAGLSWAIILKKRKGFSQAFDGFDPDAIARYDDAKIQALLADTGIIRNKLKVSATIQNARGFLEIQSKYGSFDKYIWQFTDGVPIINSWTDLSQLPVKTDVSDKMSKDLISKGFKFVGSTICYSYMQAAGLVNDHLVYCFRYKEIVESLKK